VAKYIANIAGTMTEVSGLATSTGAPDAGKIPQLDGAGRIDNSMMPVGIGAVTEAVQASENLAAGDFVNIHNVTGAFRVRKADATTAGKEAHGFVLSAETAGTIATLYCEGTNTSVTGQTPGIVFLSTTAGLASATAPSSSGNVVQRIGFASSATSINFQMQSPLVLA